MKNENRNGYKKTKVGWMPEEWSVMRLEEIASVNRGKFSARPRNDPKYYGGEYPFLQTGDVANSDGCVTSFSQTLNKDGLAVSKLFPPKTILVTIAANIGDVADVPFEFSCPDSLVAIIEKEGTNQKWLRNFLTTKKEYFKSKSTQNAQANINLETIRPVVLGVPPLEEQEAIAEVLECWDAGIRSLEKKIELKRNIKRGLMQKLLSGQSRLPGFSGEWKTVKLGVISGIVKGKQLNRLNQTETGLYPVMNGGIRAFGFTDSWNTEANTITISEGGNSCGFVNFNKARFWCGGHCYAISEDSSRIEKPYLFHSLKGYQGKIMSLRVGTGLPNIQKKALASFKISVPPLTEQKAIAEVLTDADAEVEKLEEKLARWKDQKKYLLNELVTGSIRVGAA